jgi:hypothetical protein
MAVNKYVVTADTTVAAGTAATVTAGEPQTGSPAGPGNAAVTSGQLFSTTFIKGTPLILDTGSALYVALSGAGALRAWVPGTDDVGHAALAN